MNSAVSIRRGLLGNLIIMIVLLSVAIQATMYLAARRVVRTLSASLIEQTLDQTEAQLRRFFDPVAGGLRVVRTWGAGGRLDHEQPNELNGLLAPLMEQLPQVSASMCGGDSQDRPGAPCHRRL